MIYPPLVVVDCSILLNESMKALHCTVPTITGEWNVLVIFGAESKKEIGNEY